MDQMVELDTKSGNSKTQQTEIAEDETKSVKDSVMAKDGKVMKN